MLSKQAIHTIFKRLQKANPNPTTELIYHTPFELLVAVILSAQATDKSVNLATKKLFKIANTPQKILALGETGLKECIKTIGLYNAKAKNIMLMCKTLIEQYHCIVPNDREALTSLAGVGRKTANVILNTIFGVPVIAVDTHVLRVSNRIGLVSAKIPLEAEKQLQKRVPKQYQFNAHHWLILHGRYICTARKPGCPECIINDICLYEFKTKS